MIVTHRDPNSKTIPNQAALPLGYLLDAAEKGGVAVDEVLTALGLERRTFRRIDARVPAETAHRLITELERYDGSSLPLSLRAAERVSFGDLILFEAVGGPCSSLRQVAELASRFFRELYDGCELILRETGASAELTLVDHGEQTLAPSGIELLFLAMVKNCDALTGGARPLSEVRFTHECRGDLLAYEHALRTKVTFGAERNEIVFPRVYLDLPIPRAHSYEPTTSLGEAEPKQAEVSSPSLTDRVRQLVLSRLEERGALLGAIATELGTSRRSLQRHLHAEGTSMEAIVDDARKRLAMSYVTDARLTIVQIAQRLGFGDASAFARAFRRWTSTSPSQFRMAARDDAQTAASQALARPLSSTLVSTEAATAFRQVGTVDDGSLRPTG